MGYQVYEDRDARSSGVERWAGYGVPAVCDVAACAEEIDRGLGWKCEEHYAYSFNEVTEEEIETKHAGCGLFFCSEHGSDPEKHEGVTPKPDTGEWISHMLTDESWQRWRDENPERVTALRKLTG